MGQEREHKIEAALAKARRAREQTGKVIASLRKGILATGGAKQARKILPAYEMQDNVVVFLDGPIMSAMWGRHNKQGEQA